MESNEKIRERIRFYSHLLIASMAAFAALVAWIGAQFATHGMPGGNLGIVFLLALVGVVASVAVGIFAAVGIFKNIAKMR